MDDSEFPLWDQDQLERKADEVKRMMETLGWRYCVEELKAEIVLLKETVFQPGSTADYLHYVRGKIDGINAVIDLEDQIDNIMDGFRREHEALHNADV